jgi:hypothetical protein
MNINDKRADIVTIYILAQSELKSHIVHSPRAYSKANRARVLCEPTAPNIPCPPEDHHRLDLLENAYEKEHTERIQINTEKA